MKNLIYWFSKKDFIYQIAQRILFTRIVRSNELLCERHLTEKGFVNQNSYWVQPGVKGRDKIWVQFEMHYYRVWHGEDRTFIALESRKFWFDNYYLIIHGDNGRYQLAGL